jgi:hypothetical protein
MPLMTGWKIALTAIAFVIGSGGAYWLLDLGVLPAVGIGSLFSATTLGGLMLAATAAKLEGSSYWTFWTFGRVCAYNGFMGLVLIGLGILLGFVLDAPRSTAIAVVCALAGVLMVVGSVVEYFRTRRRRNPR